MIRKIAIPLAVVAVAALAATPARAASGVSLSFAASTGSTAGWASTVPPVVALHVAHLSTPASGGYAMINLQGTGSTLNGLTEPNWATDNYGAGTPRMELVPAIGADSINNDVTGYPHSSGLCPASPGVCWSLGSSPNTYTSSWTDVQLYMQAHGGLKNVYLVADESMTAPYTTDITSLTWNGKVLIPGTTVLEDGDGRFISGDAHNVQIAVGSPAGVEVTVTRENPVTFGGHTYYNLVLPNGLCFNTVPSTGKTYADSCISGDGAELYWTTGGAKQDVINNLGSDKNLTQTGTVLTAEGGPATLFNQWVFRVTV